MNMSDMTANKSVSLAAMAKVATALSATPSNTRASKSRTQDTAATNASSSTSATDASTITSSDFLTLLVSELQNQDPTEPTDPNAYITQLVGVNSLQQLISINQGITALDPTTTTSTGSTVKSPANLS